MWMAVGGGCIEKAGGGRVASRSAESIVAVGSAYMTKPLYDGEGWGMSGASAVMRATTWHRLIAMSLARYPIPSYLILSSPAARDVAARALSVERGTSIGELHALLPTPAPAPASTGNGNGMTLPGCAAWTVDGGRWTVDGGR
jgi:hypothetical protein